MTVETKETHEMKKGKKGGDSTITGLRFEKKTDLKASLLRLPGYRVDGDRIFYDGKLVAVSLKGMKLYNKFLSPRGIDHAEVLSKKLLPDEALYVEGEETLYVIEKKYQETYGSVDEKLQTCDFKRRQYIKLVKPLGIKAELIYVLNSWYKQESYRDSLEYIQESGCHYFYDAVPLSCLGLPDPHES